MQQLWCAKNKNKMIVYSQGDSFLRALETTQIVNIAIILNNIIWFYLHIVLSCFFLCQLGKWISFLIT